MQNCVVNFIVIDDTLTLTYAFIIGKSAKNSRIVLQISKQNFVDNRDVFSIVNCYLKLYFMKRHWV